MQIYFSVKSMKSVLFDFVHHLSSQIVANFFLLEFVLHIIAFLKNPNTVVYPIGCKYQSKNNNSNPVLLMLLFNLNG